MLRSNNIILEEVIKDSYRNEQLTCLRRVYTSEKWDLLLPPTSSQLPIRCYLLLLTIKHQTRTKERQRYNQREKDVHLRNTKLWPCCVSDVVYPFPRLVGTTKIKQYVVLDTNTKSSFLCYSKERVRERGSKKNWKLDRLFYNCACLINS